MRAADARPKVIVISGSMGCGKTTVLGEASDVLTSQGTAHAAIDLDAIATPLLAPEAATDIAVRSLGAIYRNVTATGISRVLLAAAVETRADLGRLADAMSPSELVVCRLTASVDTMERRLRIREPGMHQDLFVARARLLDETLAAAKLEHFTVSNEGRHVTDVARELLQRAGWIG
jgi:hypothetical protein